MKENKDLTIIGALRYLSTYYKGMGFRFVLFYVGRLVTMLEEIMVPILVGLLINLAVYTGINNQNLFLQICLVLFGICILGCLAYYMIYEIYTDFWNAITERIREKAYGIVLHMRAEELATANYGDVAQQVQWQVTECVQLVVKNVIHNLNNIFHIIICSFLLFRMNVWVGVSAMTLVPVSAYISWKEGGKVRNERKKNQNKYGEYINWIYEVTGNYKHIRLMNAENRVKEKLIEHQNELIATDVKSSISTLLAQNVIKIADTIIQIILYAVLAYLALNRGMKVGTITIAVSYYASLKSGTMTLVEDYFSIQNRLTIIGRLQKLLERPVEKDMPQAKDIQFSSCEIKFRNVTFGYQGKEPILNNLSFCLKSGEKLALVGESGCGKSTIAYLILGFYQPNSGEILLNGKPISEYTLDSIRKNVGVVQQEVWLFEGTVRENLLFGKPDATDEELVRACEAAGAYGFVSEMEKGFETELGKHERELSGGQKQRLGIARTYLKKPSLMLFDEATSALDAQTEEIVYRNMGNMLEKHSALVIAHRLSAVKMCDRVIVLKNGKVVETGTPEEMEKNSEEFRNLFAINKVIS
jgi:ABC-type multidrug transport system fused ATPase/permease subunit